MCTEKHVYKWLKHGFATTSQSQKEGLMELKHTRSGKGKFQVQQSVKKAMLSVLWATKGPIISYPSMIYEFFPQNWNTNGFKCYIIIFVS